jgi:hypothetical protein
MEVNDDKILELLAYEVEVVKTFSIDAELDAISSDEELQDENQNQDEKEAEAQELSPPQEGSSSQHIEEVKDNNNDSDWSLHPSRYKATASATAYDQVPDEDPVDNHDTVNQDGSRSDVLISWEQLMEWNRLQENQVDDDNMDHDDDASTVAGG